MELLGGLWGLHGCPSLPGSARSLPLILQISKLCKIRSWFPPIGTAQKGNCCKPSDSEKEKYWSHEGQHGYLLHNKFGLIWNTSDPGLILWVKKLDSIFSIAKEHSINWEKGVKRSPVRSALLFQATHVQQKICMSPCSTGSIFGRLFPTLAVLCLLCPPSSPRSVQKQKIWRLLIFVFIPICS